MLIPFSFVMLGIAIFCLSDWKNSKRLKKFIAFSCFLIGAYIAAFLSGTHGTLLCLILITPILTYYLSNRIVLTLLINLILAASTLVFINPSALGNIENGLENLTLLASNDRSIWNRLEMWSAAMKAISDAPLFGYGVEERFIALKSHLPSSIPNYTHPHNDVFAGILSVGFLGGFAVLFSLISGFTAAFLTPNYSSEKQYYGLMLSCSAMITGNVSTVLFNDISSAWLAFSTYLIWVMDFKADEIDAPKTKITTEILKSNLITTLGKDDISERF